jgi:hypothetical protein
MFKDARFTDKPINYKEDKFESRLKALSEGDYSEHASLFREMFGSPERMIKTLLEYNTKILVEMVFKFYQQNQEDILRRVEPCYGDLYIENRSMLLKESMQPIINNALKIKAYQIIISDLKKLCVMNSAIPIIRPKGKLTVVSKLLHTGEWDDDYSYASDDGQLLKLRKLFGQYMVGIVRGLQPSTMKAVELWNNIEWEKRYEITIGTNCAYHISYGAMERI